MSNDPDFAEKPSDIAGHYVDPAEPAIALSIGEKSQIQALDRTRPGLPIKPGCLDPMIHDYNRNGSATLFAALEALEGKLIGQCMNRHRHQEIIRFFTTVDQVTPKDRDVHLIVDNDATPKHPKGKA